MKQQGFHRRFENFRLFSRKNGLIPFLGVTIARFRSCLGCTKIRYPNMSNQNFNLFVNMKQKLVMLASVLTLALSTPPKVSAQWVQTNAPTGQLSYAFTEMGTNLFTLTQEFSEDGTGVLLSTDSGEDWAFGDSVPTNTSFVTITAVGSNLFGSSHGGIFLSTNSGASTWSRRAGIGLGTKAGGIICSFLESKGKLFAASWSGVIFSTDSGTSWTESNAGLTDTLVGDLVLDGTNLFAGTNDSGIFLSTDNGISWSPVNNGLTGYGNGIYPLCVMGTNLFAGASEEGIFRTRQGTMAQLRSCQPVLEEH